MSSTTSARVGLITDIHWTPSRAEEIESQLGRAVERCNEEGVDYVIFLGDLVVEAASAEDTRSRIANVRSLYDRFDAPVFDIPGNHDVGQTTREDFAGEEVSGPLLESIGLTAEVDGILLDTVATADIDPRGQLGDQQLSMLDETLAEVEQAVIFSHHPLYTSDQSGGWFEEHPEYAFCVDQHRARSLFEDHGNVLAAVNGHTHLSDFTVERGTAYFTINSFNTESPTDKSVNGSFAILEVNPPSVKRCSYRHGSFESTDTVIPRTIQR